MSTSAVATSVDYDSPAVRRGRLWLFVIAAACFILCQFTRSVTGVLGPTLRTEIGLSAEQLGTVTGAFFWGIALMQIPSGILFDRYGPRLTVALTLFVGVAGGLLFAFGTSFEELTAGMFVLGLGTSAVFMGAIVLIARWWPPKRFATLSATMMSLGYVGNLSATEPFVWIMGWIGWRWGFSAAVLGLLVSAALMLLVVRDAPAGSAWTRREPESLMSVIRGLGEIFRHPAMPGLIGAALIGYSTNFAIRGLWLGLYMIDIHGLGTPATGRLLFAMAALGTIGIFLAGASGLTATGGAVLRRHQPRLHDHARLVVGHPDRGVDRGAAGLRPVLELLPGHHRARPVAVRRSTARPVAHLHQCLGVRRCRHHPAGERLHHGILRSRRGHLGGAARARLSGAVHLSRRGGAGWRRCLRSLCKVSTFMTASPSSAPSASAHPDFQHFSKDLVHDSEILAALRANPPEVLKTLNGELLDIDSARGYARFRFEVVPAFCHSQGRICQGGFLTGMVDTAMANAAIAKGKLGVAVPTLELKISFFEAMGPGIVYAEGRVMRWGGSVGFLDGDLKDEKGRLIVHSTSTIKIVRPKTKG